MSKTLKLSLVVVAVVAIAVFASSGAWAGKLLGNDQAPSVAVNETGARPQGTVVDTKTATYHLTQTGKTGSQKINQLTPHKLPKQCAGAAMPGGNYFNVAGVTGGIMTVEVGPNWAGSVSFCTSGGWSGGGYVRDGNLLKISFSTGTTAVAVTP